MMNRMGYKLVLLCLAWAVGILALPQYELNVYPFSSMIQEVGTYVFQILIAGDGDTVLTVPAGTQLLVYFPSQYSSLPTKTYACSYVAWPDTTAVLGCQLSYGILKVSGGFPTAMGIGVASNIKMRWVVEGLSNPTYAQTTDMFWGEAIYSSTQILTYQPSNSAGITFIPGQLVVTMSVSPTTADATATITFTVKPTHPIPSSGALKITLDMYWSTSVYNNEGVISQSPICSGLNGTTAPNLHCSYSYTSTSYTVTVESIFTIASNSTFSFTMFPFHNPPSGQPIGSFLFETYSLAGNMGLLIDDSANNQISGITPALILSPQLYLSSYQLGQAVEANLSVKIPNSIASTDVFFLSSPPQIDLQEVVKIKMAGVTTSLITVLNRSLISFSNIPLSSPYQINITIQYLRLPGYAASILSPFSLYVQRNYFMVCQFSSNFSLELSPGTLGVTLGSTSYEAGVVADYQFSVLLSHALDGYGRMGLYFSPSYFALGAGVSCLSSNSINCSIVSYDNNLLVLAGVTLQAGSNFTLTVRGLTNPATVGNFSPIYVYSYAMVGGSYPVVDSNMNASYFQLQARATAVSCLTVGSSSATAYALADFSLSLRNLNAVPSGASAWVLFPAEIGFAAVTCSVLCQVGTYNGSQGVQLQQFGPLAAGSTTGVVVSGLRNPISTRPTSAFKVYILNSQSKVLEYLINGPSFSGVTQPSSLGIGYVATTTRNSGKGWLNLTLTTKYDISESVTVVLTLPSQLGCAACPAQILNASYSQLLFPLQRTSSATILLFLAEFSNPSSLTAATITADILSSDQLYKFAAGSFSLATALPSVLTYSSSFTLRQLATSTDLLISNLQPASPTLVAAIIVTFPSDIDVSAASCNNSGYSCVVVGSEVRLTATTVGNLSAFTVKEVMTASHSPSAAIVVSTYSSLGSLMDQANGLVWTADCPLPCRTCSPSNTSQCLSCYSDPMLAQSRILFFANNSSCVSDCGDKYYRNYTTNSCLACSSICSSCVNLTLCTSCPTNQFLLVAEAKCYGSCPVGYFGRAWVCVGCTVSLFCYTCADELTCASCVGRFLYQGQCLVGCPNLTTTANTTTRSCLTCPTNCTTCSLSADNATVVCLSCGAGLLLDGGRCVSSCVTVGTVANGSVCSGCDSACLSCLGSPTFCLSCNASSTKPYFLSNRCYSSCPPTYYNDSTSLSCLTCTRPCETCSNFSSTGCLTCISPYVLQGTVCSTNCSATFYSSGSQCVDCPSPCLTCSTATTCFSCETNFSLLASNSSCVAGCPVGYVSLNQTCQVCSSNCLSCLTLTYCLSCPGNGSLLGGTCLAACPDSYYSASQVCVGCPSACATCSSGSYCGSCKSGYQLQSNNSCLSVCAAAQVAVGGLCVDCGANCSSCSSVGNCSSCLAGYLYLSALRACYVICPPPYLRYPAGNSCISSCPSPSYQSTNSTTGELQCVSCPQYCSSCVSGSVCGGCLSGTYFYNSLCYSPCPNTAPYVFNSVCMSCNVVDCFECSTSTCTACKSGKILVGGLCLSGCSTGQVYNSVAHTCDTLPTANTTSSGNATITSSTTISAATTSSSIKFLPLPVLLLLALVSLVILMLHFQRKVAAIPALLAVVGPLLQVSVAVVVVMGFLGSTSELAGLAVYVVLVGGVGVVVGSGVGVVLRVRLTGCEVAGRWERAAMVLGCLHVSALALLTANIGHYNSYFIDAHRPFWRRYKLLLKVCLAVHVVPLVGGAMVAFGSTAEEYLYFGGIQVAVLAILVILLGLAWLWLPLRPPPEEQSEHSSQMDQPTQQEQPADQSRSELRSNLTEKPHSPHMQSGEKDEDWPSKIDEQQQQQEVDEKDVEPSEHTPQQEEDEPVQSSERYQTPHRPSDYDSQKLPIEVTKLRKEEIKSQGCDQQSQASFAKAMSNYDINVPVIKVSPHDIPEAIEKGLFRKGEEQLMKELKASEQLSKIDSAAKLNNYPTSPKHRVVPNIFDLDALEYEDYPQPQPRRQQKSLQREERMGTAAKKKSTESGEEAEWEVPLHTKEEDFNHNIIFEEDEEENLTFYGAEESEQEQHINIFERDASLGSIHFKPTPIPQAPAKLVVEEVEEDSQYDRIRVFGQSRIKPRPSRQLQQKETTIIHADFQQIGTASEGSLQFLEEEIQGSSKRVHLPAPSEHVLDHDDDMPRPSDILRQVSTRYQPAREQNQPPKRPLPRRR